MTKVKRAGSLLMAAVLVAMLGLALPAVPAFAQDEEGAAAIEVVEPEVVEAIDAAEAEAVAAVESAEADGVAAADAEDASEESLPYVTDAAGLLTDAQLTELETKAAATSERYGCDVRIVVLDDYRDYTESATLDECAEEIAEQFGFGYGEDRDMVALFLSMATRKYSIISYGPLGKETVFTADGREALADSFLDDFADDNWYEGLSHYLASAEGALQFNETGVPASRPAAPLHILVSILFSLVIAFIVAYIVSAVIRGRSKTVAEAGYASEYAVPTRSAITYRADTYTHTTESRVYSPQKEESSDSSSFDSDSGYGHTSGSF